MKPPIRRLVIGMTLGLPALAGLANNPSAALPASLLAGHRWRLQRRRHQIPLCTEQVKQIGSLYLRLGLNSTRGQVSKIVADAFYPNCATPARVY